MLVHSFPRIHVCLLDLAGVTGRKNGGAGFTLDGLPAQIKINKAHSTALTIIGKDNELAESINGVLARVEGTHKHIGYSIEITPPSALHLGLGSKTAILLGVLAGISQTFGLHLSASELQVLSGRGGTSGVGINAFFSGGFVVDGGHPQDGARDFLPSSAQRQDFSIPPVLIRLEIPLDWRFHLFIPQAGKRLFGSDEVAFFKANTPIPANEAFESIALVYHSLVPAVMQADLQLLKKAITGISNIGFKLREIRGQSKEVRELIESLAAYPACAVGMSSLGPLVYAIASSSDSRFDAYVQGVMTQTNSTYLGTFRGRNQGFEVEHV